MVTLDGGGIWGIITLGLLQALKRQLARAVTTITEIPNLITGTSVGIYHSHIFQVPLCFTTSGKVEASTAVLMRRGQVL
jgi:patatin-like phospholipase/acyl hydrolase